MDSYLIEGGQRLRGSIAVSGAKNAALPILTVALMTGETCSFGNIPALRDIQTQIKILNTLGVETAWNRGVIEAEVKDTYNSTAPYELVKTTQGNPVHYRLLSLPPYLLGRAEDILAGM